MTKHKSKSRAAALVVIIFLAVAFAGSIFFFVAQSVINPDASIVFYDLKVNSPALTNHPDIPNSYCIQESGSRTCQDSNWKTTVTRGGFNTWAQVSQDTTAGTLTLGSSNGAGATAEFIGSPSDLRGYKLIIQGVAAGKNGNSNLAVGCGADIVSSVQEVPFNFEVISGSEDPNLCETVLNGVEGGSGVRGSPASLIIQDKNAGTDNNHRTIIKSIRYEPPVLCAVRQGEILINELHQGEKTLSLGSLGHDWKRFCTSQKVKMFVVNQGTKPDTAEPYFKLLAGKSVLIPEDEVWIVPYVAGNDGTFPTCGAQQVLDETNACRNLSAIGFRCASGLLDTITGECIAGSIIKCKDGGFYTVVDGVGQCTIYYPTFAECISKDLTYFPALKGCVGFISPEDCAGIGGTYNSTDKSCRMKPLKVYTCDDPLAAPDLLSDLPTCSRIIKTNIIITAPQDCINAGGSLQSDGITCIVNGKIINNAQANCLLAKGILQSDGISCLVEGNIVNTAPQNCASAGGKLQSDGITCVIGGKIVNLARQDCDALKGVLQADGVTCIVTSKVIVKDELPECKGDLILREGQYYCRTKVFEEVEKVQIEVIRKVAEEELYCPSGGTPDAKTGKCLVAGALEGASRWVLWAILGFAGVGLLLVLLLTLVFKKGGKRR